MKTEEKTQPVICKQASVDAKPRNAIVYADAFVEKKKKKEYQSAVAKISERAHRLEW